LRIGTGYDVHCLQEGRELVLGGVHIPHSLGLLGHSDADVLLHAVCDALLGAAAQGNIGDHFPDTCNKYKDINSMLLLEETGKIIKKAGYRVINIDSTIIAQKPKLAGYIPEMRFNIAQMLNIEVEQVSVKATTTERLGFTGREEGIAAQAVVLINEE